MRKEKYNLNLRMPEQHNIEYKASWKDEYIKWICAFANAQGGKLFAGINDSGDVIGLNDYKKLMDEIPNKVISLLGIVVDVNLHNKSKNHILKLVFNPAVFLFLTREFIITGAEAPNKN